MLTGEKNLQFVAAVAADVLHWNVYRSLDGCNVPLDNKNKQEMQNNWIILYVRYEIQIDSMSDLNC